MGGRRPQYKLVIAVMRVNKGKSTSKAKNKINLVRKKLGSGKWLELYFALWSGTEVQVILW
jgi:hypothetical protein